MISLVTVNNYAPHEIIPPEAKILRDNRASVTVRSLLIANCLFPYTFQRCFNRYVEVDNMIKTPAILLAVITIVVNSTACSRIQNYFPDKEKDYQFSTEIPKLEIPADLRNTTALNKQPIKAMTGNTQNEVVSSGKITKPAFTPVELVEYDGGATRLRIAKPIEIAWRYIGKALSHQSIEIVGRNEKQFFYVVQYDPNAKKVEDGTLWDELVFFFGSNPAQEKKYQIKLTMKNAQLSEAIVLDDKDKPLSRGAGLTLLRLLKNTINQDLAK